MVEYTRSGDGRGLSPQQPFAENVEEEAGLSETSSATLHRNWPAGSKVSRVLCAG